MLDNERMSNPKELWNRVPKQLKNKEYYQENVPYLLLADNSYPKNAGLGLGLGGWEPGSETCSLLDLA